MWESKQLIRDLCLDWWKERKEKAFQIRKLEHLLNKKHDLVNRTMLHSKEQGMGIVSFAKTLGLETKSSKINDAIKEVADSQSKANQITKDYELGKETDLTKVVMQQQVANIAFQLTLNVRNKVLSAYKDIMNMPV